MKKLLTPLLIAAVVVLGWLQLTRDGKSPFESVSSWIDGIGPSADGKEESATGNAGKDQQGSTPTAGSPPVIVDTSRYRAPDLDYPLFKVAELALADEQQEQLVHALTSLAVQSTTPNLVKSKAIAIALRLDPANASASGVNSLLERGLVPVPDLVGGEVEPQKSALELWRLAAAVRDHPLAGKSNRLLAVHVIDLALAIEPGNANLADDLKTLNTAGVNVDWQPVIGDPADGSNPTTAENPPQPVGPDGSDVPLPRNQALVKGLLVQALDSSQFAGKASQMNATAIRVENVREMTVGFNQDVGPEMDSALNEVIKFHRIRHGQLPANYQVEIAFEEQYIPKDGPSAALACALLLESLLVDIEFDPQFAVTGDLNADGSVQSVGGITGKLRGAQHRDCNVIGLPAADARVLSDLLIIEGPKALAEIQAFSLTTFDDAIALAKVHDQRAENLRKSIDLFAEVQGVLNGPQGMGMLKNQHVQERLRECVRLAPHHLSARHLFLSATGHAGTQLSLQGSIEYIDRAAAPMLRVLQQGDFEERTAFSPDEFADSALALRRIRATLDPRAREICDSIVDFAEIIRTFVNNRPTAHKRLRALVANIQSAGQAVSRAYDKMEASVDYQEEVMK